jgi:hypothetical protein
MNQYFDQAEAHIARLTQLIQQLPGAKLDINLDALHQHLARCREQYEEQQNMESERETLEHELTQLNSHRNQGPSTENDQNDN